MKYVFAAAAAADADGKDEYIVVGVGDLTEEVDCDG
jgi:hypothetical protein